MPPLLALSLLSLSVLRASPVRSPWSIVRIHFFSGIHIHHYSSHSSFFHWSVLATTIVHSLSSASYASWFNLRFIIHVIDHPSVHPSVNPSIRPSIYPSIHLSLSISVCFFFQSQLCMYNICEPTPVHAWSSAAVYASRGKRSKNQDQVQGPNNFEHAHETASPMVPSQKTTCVIYRVSLVLLIPYFSYGWFAD